MRLCACEEGMVCVMTYCLDFRLSSWRSKSQTFRELWKDLNCLNNNNEFMNAYSDGQRTIINHMSSIL